MNKKYVYMSLYYFLMFLIIFMFVGLVFWFSFPLKYKEQIIESSDEFGLEASFVASVVLVESGFRKDSVSGAGAVGLMQLMPATGREIANKLGVVNYNDNDLFNPDINIRFGCYYLNYLLNLYDGNITNALAGYNAGYNNVNMWLNDTEYSVDKVNLVTTPFSETNKFITKVNNLNKIYRYRMSL